MDDNPAREACDTGLSKIRSEIKHRLVGRGLFGSVSAVDITADETDPAGLSIPAAVKIEIAVKGRTAGRVFDRRQIEDCRLRVSSTVLAEIIAMVDELSA